MFGQNLSSMLCSAAYSQKSRHVIESLGNANNILLGTKNPEIQIKHGRLLANLIFFHVAEHENCWLRHNELKRALCFIAKCDSDFGSVFWRTLEVARPIDQFLLNHAFYNRTRSIERSLVFEESSLSYLFSMKISPTKLRTKSLQSVFLI